MQEVDAIVAGAGIWGSTLARRLAEAGRRTLVIERRSAVGGNVRCETDPETGIEIHLYGSHIFHTSRREVWDFLGRFTAFNAYRHSVLAKIGERVYHLPIGCTLLKEFFGRDLKPSELGEGERRAIFDAFIRGYTSKQWGVPPEAVDPAVIARLKVRDSFSTDYFDDPWQGIPSGGYNAVFTRLLDHPLITVKTGAEFRLGPDGRPLVMAADGASELPHGVKVYSSAPLDALFDNRFGPLPWRTLRFETERLAVTDFQGNAVVNYPEAEVPYTRIHEFRHYHPETAYPAGRTVVMREYSARWRPGDEPYYPIDDASSRELVGRYRAEAAKYPWLVLGGRLGGYRYYDMDASVAAALEVALD